MKIAELEKKRNVLENKLASNSPEGLSVVTQLQEVDFRLSVAKTLSNYYRLAVNCANACKEKVDSKQIKLIYVCFAKYACSLPGALFFAASAESEKGDKQREANQKFVALVTALEEKAKNVAFDTADDFIAAFQKDSVELCNAFHSFRNTIIPLS